jgi:dihydrofolate reductase
MISLIAAIGENNELGKNNSLLWNIPADMKRFKDTTILHSVVMGRKTFESIGKPLPNRRNIVITHNLNYKKDGVEVVHSLAQALDLFPDPNEEIFIIGGAQIYELTMDIADKLYITHINAEDKKADTYFPEIIPIVWNEVSHVEQDADDKNPYAYTFSVYEKFI